MIIREGGKEGNVCVFERVNRTIKRTRWNMQTRCQAVWRVKGEWGVGGRVPGPPTASRIAPSRELNIRVAAFKTKRNHDSPPEPSRFVLNRAALITRTPALSLFLSFSPPFHRLSSLIPSSRGERDTTRNFLKQKTVSSLNDYASRIDRELISREIFLDSCSS